MAGEGSGRRKDLDRLRIIACLSTFCYHAVQVFDLNPYYHVKSNTLSPAIDVAARLLHAVRMPLFFMIAGMVGFLAMQRYSDREFMRQRAWRLLPPFLVGIVFLTPIVKYIEMLDGRSIDWRGIILTDVVVPDLPTFLRRYFTQQRWFSWSHMWFPAYLLLLGAVLMPAMRALARKAWPPRLPHWLGLALPLLALVTIELVLRPIFPHHVPNLIWDWASMSVYIVVMLAGATMIHWPMLETALQRGLPLSLLLAALGITLYLGFDIWPWRGIGRAMTLWATLCIVIGLGPWLGRGRISGERYMTEAVLPLYVLHHVPLLVIAFAVKDQPWPIGQRYLLIVFGSFAISLAAYHLLVRPFAIMRTAFGLPPQVPRTSHPA